MANILFVFTVRARIEARVLFGWSDFLFSVYRGKPSYETVNNVKFSSCKSICCKQNTSQNSDYKRHYNFIASKLPFNIETLTAIYIHSPLIFLSNHIMLSDNVVTALISFPMRFLNFFFFSSLANPGATVISLSHLGAGRNHDWRSCQLRSIGVN